MRPYHAILVPGGGLREGAELPPWVVNRLELALARSHGDTPVLALSAGTPHRPPPLDAAGRPIFESVAAARFLLHRGADPARVFVETASYDTIGNAYFSRMIHAEPSGWRNLLVITSRFHMARTEAAFRWVYSLTPSTYSLSFEAVPDIGLSAQTLQSRLQREAASLAILRRLAPRYTSLPDFHRWLYSEHLAYSSHGLLTEPNPPDPAALASY